MTVPQTVGRGEVPAGDVIGVELTVDGMLVIGGRLELMDFPVSLGIRPNIANRELQDRVWDQVARDLTAQGVLDAFGMPHPEVAAMFDCLGRPERVLEGRWWRRDVRGCKMLRFVVCRRGDRHVVAARDEAMLVLQRVAPQIGLAAMVNTVIGDATAAPVEPLTGLAAELAEARTAKQLERFGIAPASARAYSDVVADPSSWVEITATERHAGGTTSRAEAAAGVLESQHGRIVAVPRRVCGELYGSFLPGTKENLQRALDGLMEFIPSKSWFGQIDIVAAHQNCEKAQAGG